ncbi:unnamed protein product [Peronospora belbahrii]|uniref:F-box domain-containing protein n=1 Tax=Peronospora belbahrii TaxID=622444 RepID=A0AAU9L4Z4_9STRA|nr:unnamed protein product [Peronospora belbahrii]
MENVLGDLDGKTDVLRFIVGFLSFRDWQSLSSCSRSLASSDLRRFVLSQGVLRVPPPPLETKGSNKRDTDKLPTASYYVNSFIHHMKPDMLRSITSVRVPHTGVHLLNLLSVLSGLRSLQFWDYPYWTQENKEPVSDEYVINLAAILQLLPQLEELNVSDADITLSELLDQTTGLPTSNIQSTRGHLKVLNLSETDIVDISPLVMLPQLQSLSLRRTNVTSLSILDTLLELHVLDVSETRVVEFSALKALSQLETLDISKNWITTDLSVLEHLTALRSLKATNISASDSFTFKLNCRELEILHLQNTRLTDLDFVTKLRNLVYLDIRGTHVGNRRPLAALESLEQLLLDTRERGAPLEPLLLEPIANYEWLSCLHKLKKLSMYKHNYQEDIADVLQEDVEERGATVVSTRGHVIPMAHRVPSSFLKCVSRQGGLTSLELPPLTNYAPLTLLSSTLHHLRLQQWCADDLAQIVAVGEMPAFTRLSMSLPPMAQAMDLLPLEGFVQLTELELLDVLFEDLSPLGALVNLKKLVLSLLDRRKRQLARRHKDHQTSLDCLLQLTELEELSLVGRVDFKDAALLSGMHKMRRLWLNATKIEDATPLATLTHLEILDLGLTPLTSLEGIPKLLKLQSIWIPQAVDCKALRDVANFPRRVWCVASASLTTAEKDHFSQTLDRDKELLALLMLLADGDSTDFAKKLSQ